MVLAVSEFIGNIKQQLESDYPASWIRGEISQVTRAASGHYYFSIKDQFASVRAVMWKGKAYLFQGFLKEGHQVDLLATPSIYQPRGEFQLVVESVRQSGMGQLYEQFLQLKSRLASEGLFDEHLKKELPSWPKTVGIITSLQAAALSDVIAVFRRRNPTIRLMIYPTSVAAKNEVISMIQIANKQSLCDALILCRGGGSFEELALFNNEQIARSIFASKIPIVSAIGHETDVTIADFVADVRAATPTAAAELLSPSLSVYQRELDRLNQQIDRAFYTRFQACLSALTLLKHRLISPVEKVRRQELIINNKINTLKDKLQQKHYFFWQHYYRLSARLQKPESTLSKAEHQLHAYALYLKNTMQSRLNNTENHLTRLQERLTDLNPDRILSRGYSMTYLSDGRLLKDVASLSVGEAIVTHLASGSVCSQITDVNYPTKKH